jgi:hypothetical protein
MSVTLVLRLITCLWNNDRSVRVCDPDTKACIALPDVHHGFPLHVCFLQEQILSVTLDGQITFFQKGQEYRPIRSCTVTTKVTFCVVPPLCCTFFLNNYVPQILGILRQGFFDNQ